MAITPNVPSFAPSTIATSSVHPLTFNTQNNAISPAFEPDFADCKTEQDRINRIAKCMEARLNCLDFATYRCGELLREAYEDIKVTYEPQVGDSLCKSQEEFLTLLENVELFSDEYFQLITLCKSKGTLSKQGLHNLSADSQKEFAELMKKHYGFYPTPKDFALRNPSSIFYYVSDYSKHPRISGFDLAVLHGSLDLLKEMLAIDKENIFIDRSFLPLEEHFCEPSRGVDLKKHTVLFKYSKDENFGNKLVKSLACYGQYELLKQFLDDYPGEFSDACWKVINKALVDIRRLYKHNRDRDREALKHNQQLIKIFMKRGFEVYQGTSLLVTEAERGDYQALKNLLSDEAFVTSKWVSQSLEIAKVKLKNAKEWKEWFESMSESWIPKFILRSLDNCDQQIKVYHQMIALLEEKMESLRDDETNLLSLLKKASNLKV